MSLGIGLELDLGPLNFSIYQLFLDGSLHTNQVLRILLNKKCRFDFPIHAIFPLAWNATGREIVKKGYKLIFSCCFFMIFTSNHSGALSLVSGLETLSFGIFQSMNYFFTGSTFQFGTRRILHITETMEANMTYEIEKGQFQINGIMT